jgi:hypothetical protein
VSAVGQAELVVRLPVDLHAAIKERAEAEDRSMAAVIRLALRQYVRSPLPPGAIEATS